MPPPDQDWQSPEVGAAIRVILDVFENIGSPEEQVRERMGRLGELLRGPPEITVAAYSAILNSALSLPALLPTSIDQIPEVRRRIEQQVYRDIDEMPPPALPS
jgi:hypothetical protein